ncbi:MAG: hypothetical protein V1873_02185, partial [Verrucomicrobiota bacterium]
PGPTSDAPRLAAEGFSWKQHLGILAAGLAIAIALGAVFSYPLVRHFGSSIPASYEMAGQQRDRFMFPGDQLQLLYHFWLVQDMIRGGTPWFHNPYEFNTGDDTARYEPGLYFFPFSPAYALFASLGGPAVGWNLTLLFALWMTAYFTWLLAAQYTRQGWVRLLAAALGIALPYRWISLLGGSPAGFAMAWVPMTFLGLDLATRSGSWRGGLLAGVGILLACFGDSHVLLFTVLAAPFVCVLAAIASWPRDFYRPRFLARRAGALALFALGVLGTYAFTKWIALPIEESVVSKGREIWEIGLFSPRPEGLFTARSLGVSNQVYLGWATVVLLAVGLGAALFRAIRNRRRDDVVALIVFALLLVAIAKVVVLALGPFGPFESRLFVAARKFIPPYRMIRQTGKIYVILPALLAMAVAVGWGGLLSRARSKLVGLVVAVAVVAAVSWDYLRIFRPMLCRLADRQGAYEAVAQDAAKSGAVPRALAITLWPGDSHYASVYLYYASLYHVRMVNGYRPLFSRKYRTEVFDRLESMNQGFVADSQLDDLLGMGVDYLVFHEDLYPQKVSPFSTGVTLSRLLRHPRLELLKSDGPVWAFRILKQARAGTAVALACPYHLPAWLLEAEGLKRQEAPVMEDQAAGRHMFVRLSAAGSSIHTRQFKVGAFPDLRWMIRLRGHGEALVFTSTNAAAEPVSVRIESDTWIWTEVPLRPEGGNFGPTFVKIEAEGLVDVDELLLAAGPALTVKPGEPVSLTPACCFHTGQTEPGTGDVLARAGFTDEGPVLSGPYWPLPPGEYRISVEFESPAPAGTRLGGLTVEGGGVIPPSKYVDFVVGEPAAIGFAQKEDLPVVATVHYAGEHDLRIKVLKIERLEQPSP